jgi:acetyltransferase-like isoleucine patch superfamily enzyme
MPKESGINKIFLYITNVWRNGLSFLKAMMTERDLYWNWNLGRLDNCTVNPKSVLSKPYSLRNSAIGKGTAVGPNSRMAETSIGRFCSIGPNFLCGWGIHPLDGISTSPVFYSTDKQAGYTFASRNKIQEHKPILVGNDVFIGANVTVLDGVTIGDGAVIGAGAVVSKDIPPYAIAVGCPIKIIKYRFEPEIIEKLLKIKWWNRSDEVLIKVEKHFFNVQAFINEMSEAKEHRIV